LERIEQKVAKDAKAEQIDHGVGNGGGCGHLVPTSRRVGTNDPNVVFREAEEAKEGFVLRYLFRYRPFCQLCETRLRGSHN